MATKTMGLCRRGGHVSANVTLAGAVFVGGHMSAQRMDLRRTIIKVLGYCECWNGNVSREARTVEQDLT